MRVNDPWVDFIGVPKEKTDDNGNLFGFKIRPQEFQDDEVKQFLWTSFQDTRKFVRTNLFSSKVSMVVSSRT